MIGDGSEGTIADEEQGNAHGDTGPTSHTGIHFSTPHSLCDMILLGFEY